MIQPAIHVVGLGAGQMVINGIPPPGQLDESFLMVGLAVIGNIKEGLADLKREAEEPANKPERSRKDNSFCRNGNRKQDAIVNGSRENKPMGKMVGSN